MGVKGAGIMHINGLIPAAGLSSRMGDFKPLLPLRGRTVIENTAELLLSAGAEQLVVVLGHRGTEVETLLRARYPEQVIPVYNPAYAASDMLASIKIGLAAMPACDAFFLLPGDMPIVSAATCQAVRQVLPMGAKRAVFPAVLGRRRHPALIAGSLIPEILAYDGTDGLRGFWRQNAALVDTVPVSDDGCCTDLDTPEQYQAVLKRLSDN